MSTACRFLLIATYTKLWLMVRRIMLGERQVPPPRQAHGVASSHCSQRSRDQLQVRT